MKKIITLLTLSILLIGSYKIYAEEYETLWVKYENKSFIFTQNPTNKDIVKANYYMKKDRIASKESYTVYKKATSSKWCIEAYAKDGNKDSIASVFLNSNFSLNKNNELYSIYYLNENDKRIDDVDKTPHQIGSFPRNPTYRKSFIELKDMVNKSTCCEFKYTNSNKPSSIIVSFKNIPRPDSIKVITNFLSDTDKNSKIQYKINGKDKYDIILHREKETKYTVNIASNKIKTIQIYPTYEDSIAPILSPLQKLKVSINEQELTSDANGFTYTIPDNKCNTDTTSLKLCLTLDDIEYEADIALLSPSKTGIWLYIICALAVLFISALVYFALKIWKKKKKTDSNNNGQTGNNIPVVKNNTEVPKENKEEGGEEEKKYNPGERIIDCVSTLDIAYKDLIKALNKITDETNTLQKEASKHSEQTKIINELEALLQNNTGKIGIPFQNNNSLIEKFKLVLEQLKKINGTINKEIAERKLDITDTTGNGKLIKLFETLENELEEKKATIILLNEQIVGLNKKISDLLKTTSSLNQRIADSITSQLKDICSIATEIRKKLPDKEQNKILSGIFEYIPDNINQMINDITEIGTSDYDQLCKNLSEIIINNLRHNGWIDKMLRLYSFSSDSQINTDFNERGLNTSLLGDMSMKIISMLSQLGITLNIPKIFTKYNERTTDISNQEEYLTRICSKNDEILSRIRNLDKNTICDVLHIGYTISQKEPVKSQVNIQVL